MEHQSVLNKPVSMTTWQLAHISYYFRWPNHKAIQINIANGCLGILLHCYSLFTLHLHLPKWLSRRHWFHNITTTTHVRHAMPITMSTYTGFTWSQHHKQPHSSYDNSRNRNGYNTPASCATHEVSFTRKQVSENNTDKDIVYKKRVLFHEN